MAECISALFSTSGVRLQMLGIFDEGFCSVTSRRPFGGSRLCRGMEVEEVGRNLSNLVGFSYPGQSWLSGFVRGRHDIRIACLELAQQVSSIVATGQSPNMRTSSSHMFCPTMERSVIMFRLVLAETTAGKLSRSTNDTDAA